MSAPFPEIMLLVAWHLLEVIDPNPKRRRLQALEVKQKAQEQAKHLKAESGRLAKNLRTQAKAKGQALPKAKSHKKKPEAFCVRLADAALNVLFSLCFSRGLCQACCVPVQVVFCCEVGSTAKCKKPPKAKGIGEAWFPMCWRIS